MLADSLPLRFLQTVAMTVPGSVAATGDPFCELADKENSNGEEVEIKTANIEKDTQMHVIQHP